jgi:ankyrin
MSISTDSISFVTASQGTTWITTSGTTWFSAVQFISLRDSNSVSSSTSRTSILSTVAIVLQARLSTTAVHRAVRNGDEEKLRTLLKYKPNLLIRDKHQKTALQWAFELDNQTMITILLDANPDLALLVTPADYPRISPLQYAVENDDLKTVKILLERGADPSLQPYPLKEAPLLLAIQKNNEEMLEILLERALNRSALSTISHQTPLHLAARKHDPKFVEILLRGTRRSDPSALSSHNNETPLHVAVRCSNLKGVELLLQAGSDPSASSTLSETPLHLATRLQDKMMIKMLLNAGSNISAQDQAGNTPLVIAFNDRNTPLSVLQLLLDAKANINELGLLPLHQTIRRSWEMGSDNFQYSESRLRFLRSPWETRSVNSHERLQFLIDAKADLTAVDSDGLSPLHLAVASLQTNMVQTLIMAGANISAIAPELGWTPLHYLAVYPTTEYLFPIARWPDSNNRRYSIPSPQDLGSGCADKRRVILALLLKAGADTSIKLSSGGTPLHLATQQGCPETVKALLDAGADPSVRDQFGDTPLHIAFRQDWLTLASLVEVLLDAGSDVSARNSDGYTPLYWATVHLHPWRRPQVVELLLKAGVDVTASDVSSHLEAWAEFTHLVAE